MIECIMHRIKYCYIYVDLWYKTIGFYQIFSVLQCSLAEVVSSQGSNLSFNRSLQGVLLQEFQALHILIANTQILHSDDQLVWRWDSKGVFSTHSAYNFLTFRGTLITKANMIWKLKVPYKIRIFIWLMSHNRILTKTNLLKKGWHGDSSCVFCGAEKTNDHIFLLCPFAKSIWYWLGDSYNNYTSWHNITDILNFAKQLPKRDRDAFLTIFCALCWSIWKIRNDFIFNNTPLKTMRQTIMIISHLVKFWIGIWKETDKQSAERWLPADWDLIPLQMVALEQMGSATVLGDAGMGLAY
ncbi:hypothetical protein LUZ63_018412 [Rhynchospora breviuscula]|uniref:Reverse transcriptase zinc-binding domain-containing protein n=1 Tax=Rhynchospora breviuscula TaxID=2022672 RepID=A0A9Q0C4D9_9POAL|nr:hypothetical protein LUZ63_018412 [Rhynchospora breviuscula]